MSRGRERFTTENIVGLLREAEVFLPQVMYLPLADYERIVQGGVLWNS